LISEDLGIKLENVTVEHARPRQARDRSTRKTPPFVNGAGKKKLTSRTALQQIKAQIEETSSDYDREKLQERLAKLAGGVAVIKRRRRDRGRSEGAQGSR
jgi:chaperonin GroEL